MNKATFVFRDSYDAKQFEAAIQKLGATTVLRRDEIVQGAGITFPAAVCVTTDDSLPVFMVSRLANFYNGSWIPSE